MLFRSFHGPDREHLELFGPSDGLPNVYTYVLTRDAAGAVWVGTRSGVATFDGKRFVVPPATEPLATERIRVIAEAPAGSALRGVWFGSNRILARLDRGTLSRWRMVDDLHLDELQGLAFLRDGTLLLATSGTGLVRFDGATTVRLGAANGLPTDYIFGIAEDTQGRVWASSNAGVMFVPRTELLGAFDRARTDATTPIAHVTVVDKRDGLATAQCYTGVSPSLTVDESGLVWAPSTSGAVRIDASRLLTSPAPPPARIDAIFADDRQLLPGERSVASSVTTTTFSFGATTFQAPGAVRFRYRLVGLDERWVEAGQEVRTAHYTDLPGNREYVFEVTAAQGRGPFSEKPARLRVRREPKYYETWGARILAVAGLCGVVVALVRGRERSLRHRAEELERTVGERTEALAAKGRTLDAALSDLRENDSLHRSDLALAREFVEHSMAHVDSIEGLTVRAFERPVELVGGDLWYAAIVAPRHLRILLADTTGHGVQASMRAIALQYEFSMVVAGANSPAEALARLDERLVSRFPNLELRSSAICADFVTDDDGSVAAYLSFAGAPAAFHLRRDGRADEVLTTDGFLGVNAAARRRSTRIVLAPGEGLVLATDGICEAMSPLGEAFGEDRMREALECPGTADTRFAALLDAAQTFVGTRNFDDDTTALLLAAR